MNEVTLKARGQSHLYKFSDKQLASFAVEACGGGLNAQQTADAMALQDKLRAGETCTLTMRGLQVTATMAVQS